MNRHLKKLICSVFIMLLMTGCAREAAVGVREDYITVKEKEWLKKAHRVDTNGWIYLHIEGQPFERGFQRGYLTANEIDELLNTMAYILKFETAKDLDFFVEAAAKLFRGKVSKEYIEEMKGMVAGMLFLNGFIDICWYWWPQKKESMGPGCSAFIATGESTADGKIVIAHNTWSGYADTQFCNIIVDIAPDNGHRILMQSWGPLIYSGTDFFITSAGLVGTETTIGGFSGF
ncbi:MAG: C45 family peptidase, partial [Planctomycetota bacterium]